MKEQIVIISDGLLVISVLDSKVKPGWIPHLWVSLIRFIRSTFGATPAYLLVARKAAELFLIHILVHMYADIGGTRYLLFAIETGHLANFWSQAHFATTSFSYPRSHCTRLYIQKLCYPEPSKTAQYQCFSSIKIKLDAGIIIMKWIQ